MTLYRLLAVCFRMNRNTAGGRFVKPLLFVVLHRRYAPLSVRLVQACVRPGWVLAGEALKLLPGPCVEVTQDPDSPPEDLPTAREIPAVI